MKTSHASRIGFSLFIAVACLLAMSCPTKPSEPVEPEDPPTQPEQTATFVLKNSTSAALTMGLSDTPPNYSTTPDMIQVIEPNAEYSFTVIADTKMYVSYREASATSWSIVNAPYNPEGFDIPSGQTHVVVLYEITMGATYTVFAYGIREAGVDRCFPPKLSPGAGSYTYMQTVILDSDSKKTAQSSPIFMRYYYTVDGSAPAPDAAGALYVLDRFYVEGDIPLSVVARHTQGHLADSLPVNAVYSIPNVNPPTEITSLTWQLAGSDLTFTWTDPVQLDFDHVIISRAGSDDVSIARGLQTATIPGIMANMSYTFTFTTYDSSGNAATPEVHGIQL